MTVSFRACLSGDWVKAQHAQEGLSIFVEIAYR